MRRRPAALTCAALAALVAFATLPRIRPAAGAAPAGVSGERLALFKQLAVLAGEFRALGTPRPPCRRTPARRAADAALLRRATARAARASAASLRTRAAVLRRAVARRRAGVGCAPASQAPPPAGVQTAGPPVPPPAQPPGTGPSGPLILPISLANIVHAETLDLTPALGGARLPATLPPLKLSTLNDRGCRGVNVICVGLDRSLLDAQLQDLMNANLLGVALANVASLDLSGLLTQVDSLLGSGDASGLIAVERVDDSHLRLQPMGPLARLTAVAAIPDVVVGQIQLVGVIRCPPAEAGGLPRVCVS
jgi:hypothetical protein